MNDDPIVDEVRQARKNHAEQFGNDLKAIFKDIRRSENERKGFGPLVELSPRERAPASH